MPLFPGLIYNFAEAVSHLIWSDPGWDGGSVTLPSFDGEAMNSVARHAILTAISLVAGVLLVWWVEPNTAAGVTLLVAGSVVLINGLGAAFWWYPGVRSRIWIGWVTAPLVLLSQAACESAPTNVSSYDQGPAFANAFSQCMYANGNQATGTPGPGKDSGAFAADQETCKSFAHSQLAAQAEVANQRAVGGAVLGTVLGAGLGAAIGGGRGAVIGALAGGGAPSNTNGRAPLRPARAFLSASNIPPAGVGAYGVVAIRTLPTPANHDRLMMMCRAFLASLPAQESLPASVAINDQMITVWPLSPQTPPDTQLQQCDNLISSYDLYGGISAIEDAAGQGHSLKGRGPFLIGWSPSHMRGRPDAVVLIVDMSGFDSQASFDDAFRFWQQKVVEDPSLWRRGFSLEHLRLSIRDFADHYGQSIVGALKFWRSG